MTARATTRPVDREGASAAAVALPGAGPAGRAARPAALGVAALGCPGGAMPDASMGHGPATAMPVRIATADGTVACVNDALNDALNEILHRDAAAFRAAQPAFDPDRVVGGSIGVFCADPEAALGRPRALRALTGRRPARPAALASSPASSRIAPPDTLNNKHPWRQS